MSESWKILQHDQKVVPVLLIRAHFADSSYTIYLSDLTYVWIETLDKAALLERAGELKCSIDPRQDAEQLKIFSDKLRSAIDQRPGTSIELKSRRTGTEITLGVSVPLPKPLQPLEWEFQLQRRDELVASELTRPLALHGYTLQQQLLELVKQLQTKDRVILRLADRLEISGTPLSEVFPNVANNAGSRSRAPTRAKLAQYVPGLQAFDETTWLKRQEHSPSVVESSEMLSEVVSRLPLTAVPATTGNHTWWRGIDTRITTSIPAQVQEVEVHEDTASEPEDITVFETPNDASIDAMPDVEEEPPDSSHTLSAPSTAQEAPASSSEERAAPTRAAGKKLGTIGGRRHIDKQALVHEQDPESISDVTHVPETQLSSAKPTKKFGAIGGNNSTAVQEVAAEPAPSANHIPSVNGTPKKLGVIGGKRNKTTVKTEAATASKEDVTSEGTLSTSIKQEPTEVGDADRRRELLKRPPEQRPSAPVKRARKF